MSQMTLPVSELIRYDFPEWEQIEDRVRVHTHCLYSDGQGAYVDVVPNTPDSWRVTDSANGWNILGEHLVSPTARSSSRSAHAMSEKVGADYIDGAWCIEHVSKEQIQGAILLVANASQKWTNRMLELGRSGRQDMVESQLIDDLIANFGTRNVAKFPTVSGLNKSYEFSAMVNLKGGDTALFEAVTPYAASLYASYAKMADVRASADHPKLIEAVIRDQAAWKSEDIALLRSVCESVVDIDEGLPPHLLALAA